METNIRVTLSCQTKKDGSDYWNSSDGKVYDLAKLDPIIAEYRQKIMAMNPIKTFTASESYKDMYVHEEYLVPRGNGYKKELDLLQEKLKKRSDNPRRCRDERVIKIVLSGLDDWVYLYGVIQLGSDVVVTDPCYSLGIKYQIVLNDVLPGDWNLRYQREIGENRISSISVEHKDYIDYVKAVNKPWEPINGEVGVDGGEAGFFDLEYFKDQKENHEDDFLDKCSRASYCEWLEENPNYRDLSFFIEKYCAKHGIAREEFRELDESIKDIVADEYFRWVDTYGCNKTRLRGKQIAGIVDNKGYVSSSGYGDGEYPLFVFRNDEGKIIAMKIEFINFHEGVNI